jgi:hypothetical protein
MKLKYPPFRTRLALATTGLLALATVPPAEADYSSTVLSYQPAAYWRLNETAPVPIADQAVNLGSLGVQASGFYKGTAGGTYTHPTTGALAGDANGAVTFSGGSVGVPYIPSFNTKVFTLEAWLNPNDVSGTVCPLSSVNFTTYRQGWILYTSATGWNLRLYNDTATPAINITATNGIYAGAWQHVAITCDGTNASVYVNGVLGATGINSVPYVPCNGKLMTFGARNDGNFACPGSVDEVAIYTNRLSASTIAAHYSAGTNTAVTDYSATILAANPVGYFRLGEAPWTAPDPSTLPVAINSGSLATSAQGIYQPGMATGAVGPGYDGLGGATVGAFNGLGGYVDCGTSVPDLSASLSQLTVMTWVKLGAFNMNWQAIVGCGDHSWELQRYNNADVIGFRFGGTDLWTSGARSVNDGKWHHIAATYDGALQKIYIDGTLEVSGTKTGSSGAETAYPTLIGNNGQWFGTSNDRTFNGNIGEVAVFTNALAATDIWAVYSASWNAPIVAVPAQAAPTNTTFEGATVTLSVTAAGAAPLAYQWFKNGTKLSPATASSYLLTSSAVLADSGTYSVVITNTYGSATSSVVVSIVGSAPFIVTQPASITRIVGTPATFTVVAGGSFPRTYLWKHDTTPIAGATAASLTLPSIEWADAGSYTCAITNAYGGTNTAAATLTVGGEFVSTVLPDTGARDRHVALGSDGANLFFTLGNAANASFYKIPQRDLTGWTTLAPIPLPATVDGSSGVGDMSYFGGALWTLARSPGDTGPRCVYQYDLTADAWTTGANLPGDGPNAAIAVLDTTRILGGWIGWYPVKTITDWQAGTVADIGDLAGGAVHPWDACIGPNSVYYIKHYNVRLNNGVLASINKTGTPSITNIAGMPLNPGMGCAVEYMPASLFSDGHARLYVLSGGNNNTDGDGSDWTTATSVNQLAVYDLATKTWDLQTLPFAVDESSEMCLVNQTLYVLAANSDSQPLKLMYLGPPVPPTIANQPVSQSIYLGQSATFNVSANGGGPYTYQWRLAGANLPGANGASLTVSNAWYTNGTYDVVVVNPSGSVTSQVAILTVQSLPTYANLTNGLVVHLTFDSDATTDTSGRGNNAIENGTPVLVSGKLGQAVQLLTDGINNSYLSVYDPNSDFQFGASDSFSIAFWLKYTNPFYDRPIIGNAVNSTWNPGYVLTENAGQLAWTLTTVSGSGQVIADPVGGPLLNDGAWHQITLVVDRSAGVARSFADGTLIDTRSITAVGNLASGNVLVIGQDPNGAYGNNGTMVLDDIGIWQRALTTMEAQSIYIVGQNNGRSFDSFVRGSLTLQQSGAYLQLIWEAGTLQWTEDLKGTWTDVPGAGPSFYQLTPNSYAKKFFRVKIQ